MAIFSIIIRNEKLHNQDKNLRSLFSCGAENRSLFWWEKGLHSEFLLNFRTHAESYSNLSVLFLITIPSVILLRLDITAPYPSQCFYDQMPQIITNNVLSSVPQFSKRICS